MEIEFIGKDYLVTFSELAYKKMKMIVAKCDKEVGWLGTVERIDNSNFYVRDVHLLKQEVNGGTTEIDPEAVGKLEYELWENNTITPENQNDVGLYIWGHSHVNMGTGASGQDSKQFKECYAPADSGDSSPDFYIRLITNKKGEFSISLYIKTEYGGMLLHQVPYAVHRPEYDELEAFIDAEIKEKVAEKKYVYTKPTGYYDRSAGGVGAGRHYAHDWDNPRGLYDSAAIGDLGHGADTDIGGALIDGANIVEGAGILTRQRANSSGGGVRAHNPTKTIVTGKKT